MPLRGPSTGQRRPPWATDDALLVGLTWVGRADTLIDVPTRPSQNDPDRVAQWEYWREIVGANIRKQRLKAGFSQEELALRSGVTRNVLIDVEHGRRGLLYERLFDLAEALDVPVSRLLADRR